MKKGLFYFFFLFVIFGCQDDTPTKKWVLNKDKSDEFEYWDDSKWSHELFFELSNVFALRPENSFVRDGNLVITAQKQAYWSKLYTSGGVGSKFKVVGNSRVEIRAKLPNKDAHVSAPLWMTAGMPSEALNPCFEIDLSETYINEGNDHNKFSSTLHYWWVGSVPKSLNGYQMTEVSDSKYWQRLTTFDYSNREALSDNYHIWAIERIDNKVDFYFDGAKYWSYDVTLLPEDVRDHFNNQPVQIICSVQGHAGAPNDAHLPAELLVDYIRVYDYK